VLTVAGLDFFVAARIDWIDTFESGLETVPGDRGKWVSVKRRGEGRGRQLGGRRGVLVGLVNMARRVVGEADADCELIAFTTSSVMEGWWGESRARGAGGFGSWFLNVGSSSGRHLKRVNGVEGRGWTVLIFSRGRRRCGTRVCEWEENGYPRVGP